MTALFVRLVAVLCLAALPLPLATAPDLVAADAPPTTPPAPPRKPTPAPAPAPAPPATPPTAPGPSSKPSAPAPTPAPDAGVTTIAPPAISPFDSHQAGPVCTGTVHLSDGTSLHGQLALTEGTTLRLLEIDTNRYHDISFDGLAQFEVRPEFEKIDKEWSFKEGGNDEKIYTGNWYVDRRYQIRFTYRDGTVLTGYVLGTVFYLTDAAGKQHRYFLHKDEHGDNKVPAKDVIYVTKVLFDAPPSAGSSPPAPAQRQPGSANPAMPAPTPSPAAGGARKTPAAP
ncbi:MAG: hypothetical protein ACREJ2_05150 [Planctomycetota bacterium]